MSILDYFKKQEPNNALKRPRDEQTPQPAVPPPPKKAKLTVAALKAGTQGASEPVRRTEKDAVQSDATESLTEKLSSDEETAPTVPLKAGKPRQSPLTAASTQKPKPAKPAKKPSPPASPKAKKPRKQKNPAGIQGPLSNSTFVFTGIMEGASREEYEDRVKACGAKVTSAVSTRTTFLVYGEMLETGKKYTEGKKYQKAKEVRTKIMNQGEFEEFMRKYEAEKEEEKEKEEERTAKSQPVLTRYAPASPLQSGDASALWTEKYAPRALKDLVGNNSNIEKLIAWLKDWEAVVLQGEKKEIVVRGRFDPQRNVNARAALLSGPPGIGKTTAARLVAKALGYRTIEMNASDSRSKSALIPLKASSQNVAMTNSGELVKTLVIMDEVDGMSAGDRGGIGAVIDLIRSAAVPIICICNDHNSQKLKTLIGVCYDLRFARPTKQQISGRLITIAESEGLQIEPRALDRLIDCSGSDIRQVLTMLEMWSRSYLTLSYMDIKRTEESFQKDQTAMIGNFEAGGMLLRGRDVARRRMRENLDLFFVDYQLIPLLVHENYLSAMENDVEGLTEACDSIAFGDTLEKHIRTDNEWSLLPLFGVCSCIAPGLRCSQGVSFPRFPEWFGKFSTQRKNERLLRELRSAMAGFISADNEDVLCDYIPILYKLILAPLEELGKEGVEAALETMNVYNLSPGMLREHLIELQFDSQKYDRELKEIPASVKSALTKLFNAYNAGGTEKRRTVGNSDAMGKFDPDVEEPPNEEENASQTEEEDESAPKRKKKSASRKK